MDRSTPSTSTASPKPGRARAVAAGAAALAVAALVGVLVSLGGPPPLPVPGPNAVAPAGVAGTRSDATALAHTGAAVSDDARAATRQAVADDPLLAQDLRNRLESLLLAAGEAESPQALKDRLAGLAGRFFPAELVPRALTIAYRYVDYRVALGELRPPADPSDPRALRAAMMERDALRRRFFDDQEHLALFEREEALDRLAVARMEIQRNPALSEQERAAALQSLEAELPAAERAARAEAIAHLGVAAQTQTFDAQGVDERTRHAQRSAQYGPAAAQALAQLDREQADWNARLDRYAQARQQAGDSQALRDQWFSAEEQLRLEGALGMRALQAGAGKP
ncbi:lipase secretion chaperone [Acidovorax lacteus]|uniref:Lipase helper protein n=1 Tax=Acidovorax lacteus TaxID=1924988 RepID=A0ABP8KYF5_9BURK